MAGFKMKVTPEIENLTEVCKEHSSLDLSLYQKYDVKPVSYTHLNCNKRIGKGVRAYLKNHSRNLHAPLCGIFCPNSVAVARYGASSGQNLPQIVTHILQKAFFKRILE